MGKKEGRKKFVSGLIKWTVAIHALESYVVLFLNVESYKVKYKDGQVKFSEKARCSISLHF